MLIYGIQFIIYYFILFYKKLFLGFKFMISTLLGIEDKEYAKYYRDIVKWRTKKRRLLHP